MRLYKVLSLMLGTAGLLVVMASAGCGAGDGAEGSSPLLGKWSGEVAGLALTLDVHKEYGDGYYGGALSTSNRACLIAGTMVGRLTGIVVDFSGSGSGTVSQASIVKLTGELSDGEISGLVSMTGDLETPCDLAKVPVVLSRP